MLKYAHLAPAILSRLHPDEIFRAGCALAAQLESEKRRPGFLMSIMTYHPIDAAQCHFVTAVIGLPGEQTALYAKFTAEKIYRLKERRHKGGLKEEVASSESRDPRLLQFGGCIVAFNPHNTEMEVYISFSGLPEEADEALAFALARRLGLVLPQYKSPHLDDEQAYNLLAKAAV